MVFLLQLGAVLAAGVFVAIAWTSKPLPAAVTRSLVVVACAGAYIFFWSHLWTNVNTFRGERQSWRSVAPEQAALAGVPPVPGIQPAFAEWIRERLRPGDRFYLVPSATRDEAVYQWFTYRLMPNLSSETPEESDWLIFYGTSPRASGFIHSIKGIAEQYGPGYSIARTRHAH
jgi:hypothetical protein